MRTVLVSLTLVLFATAAFAADAAKELDGAADAIRNMTASHQIPSSVLASARCVAIIPNLPSAGIIVAGKHGGGVVSCRTRAGWSAPAFITITGGSVGLQAGIEHQDLVLLMNKQGEQELSAGHWELGSEAVAAGASTPGTGGVESNDWKTPVLVYSLSSGAYASAAIAGSKISVDDQTMRDVYGPDATLQSVLNGARSPGSAQAFLIALKEVAAK
jgi:SH3 domain-containing YSC84-like protein 1